MNRQKVTTENVSGEILRKPMNSKFWHNVSKWMATKRHHLFGHYLKWFLWRAEISMWEPITSAKVIWLTLLSVNHVFRHALRFERVNDTMSHHDQSQAKWLPASSTARICMIGSGNIHGYEMGMHMLQAVWKLRPFPNGLAQSDRLKTAWKHRPFANRLKYQAVWKRPRQFKAA